MHFRQFGLLVLMLLTALPAHAQTRRPKPVKKVPAIVAQPTPAPSPPPTPAVDTVPKKNERPIDTSSDPAKNASATKPYIPAYFYEFNRPGFTIPRILIEHDDAGRGKITFQKEGHEAMISDPVDLSPTTMTKLRGLLTALDFLNSTVVYQYEKDYSHLGNVTITVNRDGKGRSVKYNWTENKDALALMNEYRRIGNEYLWKFDLNIARQNQPLETPGLMDQIIDYVGRGEISDPPQMIPFLNELSTDERMPLMARNRALKLIKTIQSAKK